MSHRVFPIPSIQARVSYYWDQYVSNDRYPRGTRARAQAILDAANDLNGTDAELPVAQVLLTFDEFAPAGIEEGHYGTAFLSPLICAYQNHFDLTTFTDQNSTVEHLRRVAEMLERVFLDPGASGRAVRAFDHTTSSSALAGAVRSYTESLWVTVNTEGRLERVHDYRDMRPPSPTLQPEPLMTATTERPVTEEETSEPCAICMESPKRSTLITELSCTTRSVGHWFHTECIDRWFEESGERTCPFRCPQLPVEH